MTQYVTYSEMIAIRTEIKQRLINEGYEDNFEKLIDDEVEKYDIKVAENSWGYD